MKVEVATWKDHKEILKLSSLSKFTKGFSGVGMGRVEDYYKRGWVSVVRQRTEIVGFLCVHHCVKRPARKTNLYAKGAEQYYDRVHTSVYYIGTSLMRKGIGKRLIQHALKTSPNNLLELISEKENVQGLAFYKRLGFKIVGEGANKAGVPYWRLMLEGK